MWEVVGRWGKMWEDVEGFHQFFQEYLDHPMEVREIETIKRKADSFVKLEEVILIFCTKV